MLAVRRVQLEHHVRGDPLAPVLAPQGSEGLEARGGAPRPTTTTTTTTTTTSTTTTITILLLFLFLLLLLLVLFFFFLLLLRTISTSVARLATGRPPPQEARCRIPTIINSKPPFSVFLLFVRCYSFNTFYTCTHACTYIHICIVFTCFYYYTKKEARCRIAAAGHVE